MGRPFPGEGIFDPCENYFWGPGGPQRIIMAITVGYYLVKNFFWLVAKKSKFYCN
jgi:hypothetical protein